MMEMDLAEARDVLKRGDTLARMAEAVGVIATSDDTTVNDLTEALRHGGFVAEQAALALYKRTSRPTPVRHELISTDPKDWQQWIEAHAAQVDHSVE